MALREIGVKDGQVLTPSSLTDAQSGGGHKIVKYPYIDALRGYAVLLVIFSHTGGMFPSQPYPIKKLTNLGWFGVQLFFLVSCVTLMMSWHSDERKGIASPIRFWIRRYFRIAPMYYLAALFYLLVEPPAGGFDLTQMIATLTFINAWHPALLSTLDGGWRVVPGGWSISVEFCFYLLFPLIVTFVRTPRNGIILSLFCMAVGYLANGAVREHLLHAYGQGATDTFLYFWLPSQMFVFALGTVLYYAIDEINKNGAPKWTTLHPTFLISVCLAAIVALGENPTATPNSWSLNPFLGPPQVFYITLLLMCLAIVIAANPQGFFVNKPIRALGTVSFSAYIFHFFVVHQLAALSIFDATHRVGTKAILVCGALFAVTVPITFCISWLTYHYVEEPMIKVGSRLAAFAGRRKIK